MSRELGPFEAPGSEPPVREVKDWMAGPHTDRDSDWQLEIWYPETAFASSNQHGLAPIRKTMFKLLMRINYVRFVMTKCVVLGVGTCSVH
jgi:hypothetical protein